MDDEIVLVVIIEKDMCCDRDLGRILWEFAGGIRYLD